MVPSPHGFLFRAPGELHSFVAALRTYSQKLSDYDKFKEANPNFQEEIEAQRKEEGKGWEWNPLRSVVDRFIG